MVELLPLSQKKKNRGLVVIDQLGAAPVIPDQGYGPFPRTNPGCHQNDQILHALGMPIWMKSPSLERMNTHNDSKLKDIDQSITSKELTNLFQGSNHSEGELWRSGKVVTLW
jgi:hypothetical protein